MVNNRMEFEDGQVLDVSQVVAMSPQSTTPPCYLVNFKVGLTGHGAMIVTPEQAETIRARMRVLGYLDQQ